MSALARLREALRDPNPIVRKELLVFVRTPLYVRAVVVALIVLALMVISTAIAVSDGSSETTEVGRALFQIFYGSTYLVTSLVGPVFAGASIAHERETRTIDALTLSALGPKRIVRGKLAAIFLASMFIPMTAVPVLGVVVLFGGVSLGHLVVATVYLLLVGACQVAFGLAISAHVQTARRASAAAAVAMTATFSLGAFLTGAGYALGRRYSFTLQGPFFFADAYFAMPWGVDYAVLLVILPLYVIGVTLGFCYAVAVSGMMDPTEDRALPLKRWVAGALAVGIAALAGSAHAMGAAPRELQWIALALVTATSLLGIALFFAFTGEPVLPSRRMELHPPKWHVRTFFPPCLVPATFFVLAATALAMLLGPFAVCGRSIPVMLFGLWCVAYLSALGGFLTWLAVRSPTGGAANARVFGAVALFVTFVALWLAAALLGKLNDPIEHPPWMLALSPPWALAAAGMLLERGSETLRYEAGSMIRAPDVWHYDTFRTLVGGAVVYAVVGVIFLTLAVREWKSARARREATPP